MERVHYRRYTPSRLYDAPKAQNRPLVPDSISAQSAVADTAGWPGSAKPMKESSGFREKLIIQGIISAIILAAVLVLSIVDNPHAMSVRGNLSQAISGHITAEQVAVEVNRFLAEVPLPGDVLRFDGEPDSMALPAYIESVSETVNEADTLPDPTAAPIEQQAGRIDEDVLREAFGWTDGDNIQTTAPEPIILPEL